MHKGNILCRQHPGQNSFLFHSSILPIILHLLTIYCKGAVLFHKETSSQNTHIHTQTHTRERERGREVSRVFIFPVLGTKPGAAHMAGNCSWTCELCYVCLPQPSPRNNSHPRSEHQFSLAFSLFPWNTCSHLWEPWFLGDIAYLPSEARYQGQKNLECSAIPHTEASKTDEAKDAGANKKWLPAGRRWNSWSVRIGMWWI